MKAKSTAQVSSESPANDAGESDQLRKRSRRVRHRRAFECRVRRRCSCRATDRRGYEPRHDIARAGASGLGDSPRGEASRRDEPHHAGPREARDARGGHGRRVRERGACLRRISPRLSVSGLNRWDLCWCSWSTRGSSCASRATMTAHDPPLAHRSRARSRGRRSSHAARVRGGDFFGAHRRGARSVRERHFEAQR